MHNIYAKIKYFRKAMHFKRNVNNEKKRKTNVLTSKCLNIKNL